MKSAKLLLSAIALAGVLSLSAQEVVPAIARDSKIERRVEEILKGMTLEEKVGQMAEVGIDMFGNSVTGVADDKPFILNEEVLEAVAKQYKFGSVLNAPGKALSAEEWNRLIEKINEVSLRHTGLPVLYGIDAIHGATYTWASPLFPQEVNAAASFNRAMVRKMAEMTAYEVRASNIPWTYSPTLDLGRKSSWPRQWESFSEDAYLSAELAREMVLGYQGDGIGKQGNIAACVKHFAAYGAATAGRDYSGVELCERTLLDDYLPSYEAAIAAGAPLVMSAFNTINRIPCSTNKWLLRKILREQMGFDGVVISDYGAVQETVVHTSSCDKEDAAAKALKAGVDIDMMSDCYLSYLEEQAEANEELRRLIDESCFRVLELKNKLGLFDNPVRGSKELEEKYFYCEEHKELSVRAARESAILLKNEGLLPLAKDSKITVVGKLAVSTNIVGSWAIFAEADKTVKHWHVFQGHPKGTV